MTAEERSLRNGGRIETPVRRVGNTTGNWYWITEEQAADLRLALANVITQFPLDTPDEQMLRQLAEALAP